MFDFILYCLRCAAGVFNRSQGMGGRGLSSKDVLVGHATIVVLVALFILLVWLYRLLEIRLYRKRHPFQRNPHYLTEEDDWRLMRGQEAYLKGVTLKKQAYQPIPPNDHDHCEFCMEKFSANHLTEGYCTPDEKIWICPACYAEFQKQFAWKLEQ